MHVRSSAHSAIFRIVRLLMSLSVLSCLSRHAGTLPDINKVGGSCVYPTNVVHGIVKKDLFYTFSGCGAHGWGTIRVKARVMFECGQSCESVDYV